MISNIATLDSSVLHTHFHLSWLVGFWHTKTWNQTSVMLTDTGFEESDFTEHAEPACFFFLYDNADQE